MSSEYANSASRSRSARSSRRGSAARWSRAAEYGALEMASVFSCKSRRACSEKCRVATPNNRIAVCAAPREPPSADSAISGIIATERTKALRLPSHWSIAHGTDCRTESRPSATSRAGLSRLRRISGVRGNRNRATSACSRKGLGSVSRDRTASVARVRQSSVSDTTAPLGVATGTALSYLSEMPPREEICAVRPAAAPVLLAQLLPVATCRSLAAGLLVANSQRRDLDMPHFGTRRRLEVLGPDALDRDLPEVASMYHGALLDLAREVVGLDAMTVPSSVERYVANLLRRKDDEHGGHYDDYPLALTVLVASAHSHDDRAWWCGSAGERKRVDLRVGDGYLLRSDTFFHGVAPLQADGLRAALTFAFGIRGLPTTVSGSADLLYN